MWYCKKKKKGKKEKNKNKCKRIEMEFIDSFCIGCFGI